jgi:hypothetical protein
MPWEGSEEMTMYLTWPFSGRRNQMNLNPTIAFVLMHIFLLCMSGLRLD